MSSDPSISNRPARETDGLVIREHRPARTKGKSESYLTLQRDLTLRLNHLKAEAREASESWIANVDSDVSTLVEFLNGSSEVRRPKDAKAATMDAWMKMLDETILKPHKGRPKDLRRIDRAIRSMMETAFE